MVYYFNEPKRIISPREFIKHKMTYLLIKAAYDKNIDCQVLIRETPENKKVVYLCFKKNKKNIWICPQKNFFNLRVSCDLSVYKNMTHHVLEAANVPVPKQVEINRIEQLKKIKIPAPWVIKPLFEYGGKNVVVDIKSQNKLLKITGKLLKKYKSLLIEEFIEGEDFRLLILDNHFLGAVKRVPAQIKGDGVRTIKELIEYSNQYERKKIADSAKTYLKPIPIDSELEFCLKKQDLDLNSIPTKDKAVYLRKNANVSTGGEAHDMTEIVHPRNIKLAIKAVQALGLKLGGVDFITKNISRPIKENNGKITEINSLPSLWIHRFPNVGKGRNVAEKILDYLLNSYLN